MTKQEKIRAGIISKIKDKLHDHAYYREWDDRATVDLMSKADAIAKYVLSYLHSQGLVIKVKCPDCEWSQFVGEDSVGMTPCHSCNSTGYLVEPLIKE